MLGFIVMTINRGQAVFHPKILSRPVLIRAVFEVIGRLFLPWQLYIPLYLAPLQFYKRHH
jgi:hypothetical protein